MKISKRLELLSNEIVGFDSICDVGCDHGLFSIYSIITNNIKHAYLLDVNLEPLNTAKKNFVKYKLENATFVLSDGLLNFNEKFDCLVIAGVGGYLMTKILNDSLEKVKCAKKLILQPNSDFDVVRKFLLENDFTINFENMILENNKYCYYLTSLYGKTNYSKEDIKYGPVIRKNNNDVYYSYYEKKYNVIKKELVNILDEEKKNNLLEELNSINVNILKVK